MTTKTRLGKTYKKVQISDLSINDHFMNSSSIPAKLKSIQDDGTCTISWTYGIDNKEGDTSEGIWTNDHVWIELKK